MQSSPQNHHDAAAAIDLVLLGCGHAHVHVLRMLGMNRSLLPKYLRITLVSDTSHTPYSGMLPGYLAGHYLPSEIHLDCHKLARFAGARLIRAAAVGVTYNESESGGGTIQLADGRPDLRYDCLSIDIGSAPTSIPVSSQEEESPDGSPAKNDDDATAAVIIPVKPISRFTQHYHEIVEQFQRHCRQHAPNETFTIAVVGGGAAGVELALSVQYHLQQWWMEQQQKQQQQQ